MDGERRAGTLIITHDLLKHLLNVPDDHKIVSVYSKPEKPYVFFVVIEGPDMPVMWENSMLEHFTTIPEKWLKKE